MTLVSIGLRSLDLDAPDPFGGQVECGLCPGIFPANQLYCKPAVPDAVRIVLSNPALHL
jgi:hypothetical protein